MCQPISVVDDGNFNSICFRERENEEKQREKLVGTRQGHLRCFIYFPFITIILYFILWMYCFVVL